jgi:Subtilase family
VSPANPASTYTTPLASHPLFVSSRFNHDQNHRNRIFCRISPVAGSNVAQGTWTITLTETAGVATAVDCWLYGVPDKHPVFIQADRDRTRTISSPGTAINAITVGAYDPSNGKLASFSSRGPIVVPASPDHKKPDLSAPGVGIVAPKARVAITGCCHGEGCCCACCVDFYRPLQGTSMAAPHVTGVVALMLQRKGDMTFTQIRNLLRQQVRAPDPGNADGAAPNDNWGAGKLDAEAVCTAVPHASVVPVLLPVAAYPTVFLPHHERLRAVHDRIAGHPEAQILAGLISTHFDEAARLINGNRRVALAWHRMCGPDLVRLLLHSSHTHRLPAVPGMDRLLDELHRAGTPALRADIERYRPFLLALPGTDLTRAA